MSLAKNTFYYTLALVYQKVLGFIYFILIGRILGVIDTGQYVLAVSFAGIFFILTDIGLVKVLIRQIAQKTETFNSLYNQIFTIKVILGIVTAGLMLLAAHFMSYGEITKQLIYIATLAILLDSFSLINWGVFRGFHNLRYESFGILGFQTIIVGIGSTMLFLGFGVIPLMVASLLGSIFNFTLSFVYLIKKYKLKIKIVFAKEKIIEILKTALPFALAGVFSSVYTMIDTVMLSKLGCGYVVELCEQNVGWYGVAAKIIIAFQFIPMALSASLFPAFSRQIVHEHGKLIKTFSEAWRYLAFIVTPISIGIIVLAPELVTLIWGIEFLPAAAPLRILMVSLIFIFLTFPNGALLNASGHQAVNTKFMGYAVIVNVLLNWVLIIQFSMIGAAVASMASSLLLVTLGLTKSYKIIKFSCGKMAILITKILASGLIMALAIIYLKSLWPLWLIIITGAIVYLVFAWLIKLIRKEDLLIVKGIFGRKQTDTI